MGKTDTGRIAFCNWNGLLDPRKCGNLFARNARFAWPPGRRRASGGGLTAYHPQQKTGRSRRTYKATCVGALSRNVCSLSPRRVGCLGQPKRPSGCMTAKPYETFDVDLREGKAREDAFAHVMLRSRVEHKRDKKAARTGNIAIEVAQKCRDGEHRDSGVFATTAERFAIEYAPECWLLMPTEYVRALARLGLQQDRHRWIGDGGNHLNVLVPIEWFVRLPLGPREASA